MIAVTLRWILRWEKVSSFQGYVDGNNMKKNGEEPFFDKSFIFMEADLSNCDYKESFSNFSSSSSNAFPPVKWLAQQYRLSLKHLTRLMPVTLNICEI